MTATRHVVNFINYGSYNKKTGLTKLKLQNYFGEEAADSLGAYFGVAQRQPPKVPKERLCPNVNCQELNTPEAPFCKKCRISLSVAGHLEREQEILELKEQMSQSKQEIKERFQSYESKMAEFVHDIQSRLNQEETSRPYRDLMLDKMREILDRTAPGWFQEVFGPNSQHRLTPQAHEKIDGWIKILTAKIDAENRQREVEIQKHKKVLMDSMGV